MTMPISADYTPVAAIQAHRQFTVYLINPGANIGAATAAQVRLGDLLSLIAAGDLGGGAAVNRVLGYEGSPTPTVRWVEIDVDNLSASVQERLAPANVPRDQYVRGGASGLEAGALPNATTGARGLIQIATQAIVDTGTNTVMAVTPSRLASRLRAVGAAAWARAVNPTGRIPSARAAGDSLVNLTMAISGQTLSVTITPRVGSSVTRTITLPAGTGGGGTGPTPATHQIYAAWGAVGHNFTAADMQAGIGTTTGELTFTGATGRGDFAVWGEMAHSVLNPVGRSFDSDNDIAEFTASRLQIGADNGHLYVAENVPAAYANGLWRIS